MSGERGCPAEIQSNPELTFDVEVRRLYLFIAGIQSFACTKIMDDEDEFVDAVDGREEEEGLSGQEDGDEAGDNDDGFGDDDFGDFGDFNEQQGSEDEDEVHEEYDPDVEETAQRAKRIQMHEPSAVERDTIEEASSPLVPPLIFFLTKKFLDFKGKTREQIRQEVFNFLEEAHPSPDPIEPPPSESPPERLDNERAMSLWNQLAAPVPLNPPDWKRSRIRRLFLVSLGVPVNLDEILPASGKKKKLVLPSTKPETLAPTLSGKLPPVAPPFDPVSARHQASVSTLALRNMTESELRGHIETLKVVNSQASESLTYWLARREEAVGEKESLEGVIESLVGWTERQRKGTTGIAMVPGRGKTPPPQPNVKKGRKK